MMDHKNALHPKKTFTNVRELIEWAEGTYGEAVAYSFRPDPRDTEATRVSYRKLANDVRAYSSVLLQMGCAGRHCLLVGKLTYEWVLTYYAVLSVGGVLVPLDRDWTSEDLADTAEKADAAFLFGDPDIRDKLDAISNRVQLEAETVYLTPDSVGSLIGSGRELFARSPESYYSAPVNPMKMSLLVFTSGTTGKGKGVMLSQNAILSDMSGALPYIDYGSKTMAVLPPHHTYGSTVMFIAHLMIGTQVYISSGLRYITKELAAEKPEHLVMVPLYLETFYRKIISNLKEQKKDQLVSRMMSISKALRYAKIDIRRKTFDAIHSVFGGRLKAIICGGAPLSREMLDFYDGIGISILNGYGITECAPLISVNPSKHNILGSVGQPIDEVSVRIDDPNEQGEGEILVKGPNVMLGYYKDDAATADAFKNGYFRTGDYGKIGGHGEIYITGRKKNLIILSNGKNVYPEEIENALSATPGVLDIVVYEGQSKRGLAYNAIVAEVYPDKEYFDKQGIEDIKAYLKPFVDEYNKTAVPYKKISILKVRREEFPKNTLRKIQRFKINTTIE